MKTVKTVALIGAVAAMSLATISSCKKGGDNTDNPTPQPETPEITITTQPTAATTVTEGDIKGSLTVAATVTEGKTPSYQWYKNTENSTTGGTKATGATATTETFSIPTDLTAGDHYFFCEVSAEGATAKLSNVATVTVNPDPATVDAGVVINGVKWATRNVDAPGKFADKPEYSGMFYQWNRKKAWPATGETVTDWDATTSSGTTWAAENDPCPTGWRVPTKDEFEKLLDKTKVTSEWVSAGVTPPGGRTFTDIATDKSIFIPLAGARKNTDGALSVLSGNYWSALPYSTTNSYYVYFDSARINCLAIDKANGHQLRCVADL